MNTSDRVDDEPSYSAIPVNGSFLHLVSICSCGHNDNLHPYFELQRQKVMRTENGADENF